MVSAGYSATPLPKKLGLEEGGTLVIINAPEGIGDLLIPLPAGSKLSGKLATSNKLVLLFCKDATTLKKTLPAV